MRQIRSDSVYLSLSGPPHHETCRCHQSGWLSQKTLLARGFVACCRSGGASSRKKQKATAGTLELTEKESSIRACFTGRSLDDGPRRCRSMATAAPNV